MAVALYAYVLPQCYLTAGNPRAASIAHYERLEAENFGKVRLFAGCLGDGWREASPSPPLPQFHPQFHPHLHPLILTLTLALALASPSLSPPP